jgi:hypothetical protein
LPRTRRAPRSVSHSRTLPLCVTCFIGVFLFPQPTGRVIVGVEKPLWVNAPRLVHGNVNRRAPHVEQRPYSG